MTCRWSSVKPWARASISQVPATLTESGAITTTRSRSATTRSLSMAIEPFPPDPWRKTRTGRGCRPLFGGA